MSGIVAVALAAAGLALSWAGAAWDVSWHRTIGRDTFWSAPHLLLYAGVGLTGLGALAAVAHEHGRRPLGRQLALGPLRADLGMALVGIGSVGMILSAPLDDMWHARFGPDIDVWSAPHLVAIAFAALRAVGFVLALEAGRYPLPEPARVVLRGFGVACVIGVFVFALNFYAFAESTREALFYPLLVIASVPFALALAARLIDGRFAVTAVAAGYTLAALATNGALRAGDWLPAALPPLVLAGAVAVDLVRARTTSALAIGAAFSLAFVAAEGARILLFSEPTVLSRGPSGARAGALFLQYVSAAAERPWASLWPVASAVVCAPLAAASWSAGVRLVRFARRRSVPRVEHLPMTDSTSPSAIPS